MNKLSFVWRNNFILRIKEQETRLILHEHDDDDNDDDVFDGHYPIQ